MFDPRVRLQVGFAFNGRRTIYDPIRGDVADNFELQESIYFITYRLFPHDVELDDILDKETKVDKIIDSKARVSNRYGELYDQELVAKYNAKINDLNK